MTSHPPPSRQLNRLTTRDPNADQLSGPDAPGPASESQQYSLTRILVIWASVTVPMGVLAFVVAPALMQRTPLHPGLVYWICLVAGMAWQFVLSLMILRQELGGLRWGAIKQRIWANLPRDPRTGRTRWVLFWWTVPAIAANVLAGMLATPLNEAWTRLFPALSAPWYTNVEGLADPRFQGQWWILGLTLTSMLFNYLLGEELLFRGILLPRMAGVFGRWDWVANAVLFGLYHVHKIWVWPAMVATGFSSWATRRFRSFWMGVIVHGVEGYFVVLVVAVLLGWYP